MVSLSALSIVVLGLINASMVVLIAGIVGGFVTGWLTADSTATAYERIAGGLHGMHASGLSGLVLVATLMAMDMPASVESDSIILLFIASPIALVVFTITGFFGGYLGISLRISFLDSTPENHRNY